MESTKKQLELLFEKAVDYIETRLQLFKLQAVDKTADVLSALVCMLLLGLVFSIVFFILNIGLALWIGSLLGKSYEGFFIVAGFYTVIGLIVYLLQSKVLKAGISNV